MSHHLMDSLFETLCVADPPPALPRAVADCVRSWYGETGDAWLSSLHGVVSRISSEWNLSFDGFPFDSASHAYVAPVVVSGTGEKAVLKVAFPDPENVAEGDALSLYEGRGAVRIHRRDPTVNAILLERVSPGRPLSSLASGEEMLRIQGAVLARVARPLLTTHAFTDARRTALHWHDMLCGNVEAAVSTVSGGLLSKLDAFLVSQASSADVGILVDVDCHSGNFLSSDRESFLLVDPKPVAASAEFEAGCMLAPFAFGAPRGDAPYDIGHLADVASEARTSDPALSARWAAAKAMQNFLWAMSVRDRDLPAMSRNIGSFLEATLAV